MALAAAGGHYGLVRRLTLALHQCADPPARLLKDRSLLCPTALMAAALFDRPRICELLTARLVVTVSCNCNRGDVIAVGQKWICHYRQCRIWQHWLRLSFVIYHRNSSINCLTWAQIRICEFWATELRWIWPSNSVGWSIAGFWSDALARPDRQNVSFSLFNF